MSNVIPFTSREERDEDKADAEEMEWLRRLSAGDPAAIKWWGDREVELPFGVRKRYRELTLPEVRIVVEMSEREAAEAAAQVARSLAEIERMARAGDPDCRAYLATSEYQEARAAVDARRKAPR